MDGDMGVGVDAAGIDVTQQDQHQEPELGPVMRAFCFERDNRAAGIFAGPIAVLGGKIGRKTVEVAGRHPHGRKHGRQR